eukprot:COSAG06_NODE_28524_length_572_cov_4.255814_1_plen_190_part_11
MADADAERAAIKAELSDAEADAEARMTELGNEVAEAYLASAAQAAASEATLFLELEEQRVAVLEEQALSREAALSGAAAKHAAEAAAVVAEHESVIESLHAAAAERSQSVHTMRAEHASALADVEQSWTIKLQSQAAAHEQELAALRLASGVQDEQSQAALTALTTAAEERAVAFESQREEHSRALAALG